MERYFHLNLSLVPASTFSVHELLTYKEIMLILTNIKCFLIDPSPDKDLCTDLNALTDRVQRGEVRVDCGHMAQKCCHTKQRIKDDNFS